MRALLDDVDEQLLFSSYYLGDPADVEIGKVCMSHPHSGAISSNSCAASRSRWWHIKQGRHSSNWTVSAFSNTNCSRGVLTLYWLCDLCLSLRMEMINRCRSRIRILVEMCGACLSNAISYIIFCVFVFVMSQFPLRFVMAVYLYFVARLEHDLCARSCILYVFCIVCGSCVGA